MRIQPALRGPTRDRGGRAGAGIATEHARMILFCMHRADPPVYAPHLVDAEAGQEIRGLVLRGLVDPTAGALARLAAATGPRCRIAAI